MNHGDFWTAITILCLAYKGRVTSGARAPERNAEVAGEQNSYHVLGLGADIVLPNYDNLDIFRTHADRLGLRIFDERNKKGHLHLQPK
jgi:uncharacterized protein YcbK (DUF882 family)